MKFIIFGVLTLLGLSGWAQSTQNEVHNQKGFEAFKKDVWTPILRKQCVMCHDDNSKGPNHSSSDPWVSYNKVLAYTNFGNLKYSKFITKGSNGHGNAYGGNVTITEDQLIEAFQQWWKDGQADSFFEGKKVLTPQSVPVLSEDGTYKTMSWDLSQVSPELAGMTFQIDVQRFMKPDGVHQGAYRLKNPRFMGGGNVEVQGIHVVVNGTWDSMANDYATIQGMAKPNVPVSRAMQIVLEPMNGNNQITFAFEKINTATGDLSKVVAIQNEFQNQESNEPRVAATKYPSQTIKAFDGKIVDKAAIFVKIKPGEFEMGSLDSDPMRFDNEILHKVKLTHAFEIQATPVTQLQWYLIMGQNPSSFKDSSQCDGGSFPEASEHLPAMCKHHPVEQVSWEDIQGFILKLNQAQTRYTYRLPTEAEWEYVARSGLPVEYAYGFGPDFDPRYAWFTGNSQGRTHAVATREPIPSVSNPEDMIWDMYGNVREWMQDWYGDYPRGQAVDPTGPTTGSDRVIRGGSWDDFPQDLRAADRVGDVPGFRYYGIGFRLVRTPNSKP